MHGGFEIDWPKGGRSRRSAFWPVTHLKGPSGIYSTKLSNFTMIPNNPMFNINLINKPSPTTHKPGLADTFSVNLTIAVCPAEFTTITGIAVPAFAVAFAVKVSVPEGFVSLAA